MSTFDPRTWTPGPATLDLLSGEVHIWRVCLDQNPETLRALLPALSGEEQVRASRFRFPEHRDRYIVSHAALRDILYRYRCLAQTPLRFVTGLHGKPELAGATGDGKLQFNLSHSHLLALIAVTADRQVGVDIEHCRQLADWQDIARRYFSASECRALGHRPENEQMAAFFTYWTRKEAFLKATGLGLSISLPSFSTELSADKFIKTESGGDPDRVWSLADLFPSKSYAGALVVEGHMPRLIQWSWDAGSKSDRA